MKHIKPHLYASLAINGLYFLILGVRAIKALHFVISNDYSINAFLYEMLNADILFFSGQGVLDLYMVWYAPLLLLMLVVYGVVVLIRTKPRSRILRTMVVLHIIMFLTMLFLAVLRIGTAVPYEYEYSREIHR